MNTYRGCRPAPMFAAAVGMACATVSLAGCGASGGGTSIGTYTGSGTTTMSLSGQVVDGNNNPLPGYSVSIDSSTPVVCDTSGNYTISIPTIQIQSSNTIDVYNAKDVLAHVEQRPIDTAICIQTLKPIVVGPPGPPGLP